MLFVSLFCMLVVDACCSFKRKAPANAVSLVVKEAGIRHSSTPGSSTLLIGMSCCSLA